MTTDDASGASGRPKRPEPQDGPAGARTSAEQAFVRGLVERGEAAYPDQDGKLPPGATHEIIGEGPDGLPIVRRRRFAGR
jgi:hypothetical protein